MNRKRWAPLAAVAAVAGAAVALALQAGVSRMPDGGRVAGPPMIRFASESTSADAGSSPDAGSSAAAYPSAGAAFGPYRLTGALPDGPKEAGVRDLPAGAASVTQVHELATALGESIAPKRVGGTWKAGDLVVTDGPGNPWTWGAICGPDTPVTSEAGVANGLESPVCAGGIVSTDGTVRTDGTVSGGSGGSGPSVTDASSPSVTGSMSSGGSNTTPLPIPPKEVQLTDSQALAATATIRGALGLSDAPARVEGLRVVIEPRAGGLPTNGMATLLQLSGNARLVSATGWLSTGRDGDVYPLRSARKAFDDIPVFAIGAPCDASGCPQGPAVTGARLGLSRVTLDKGAAALVPAWLFTVQDSPVPLVALAVADRYLSGPGPANDEPGTPSAEPGAEPGARPGVTEPGSDGSITPPPTEAGKPAAPGDRQAFGFDAAYAGTDPKVLVIRYGDSGSCPSLAVRHNVVQRPDRVVVTLTRTPMVPDQACSSDYGARLVRISLSAPLHGGEVFDGSRQEPVPISTGSPPFG